MINVVYTKSFVRRFKKLENDVEEEAFKKIELFKNRSNHRVLKVHKLHGDMKDSFSFSVNQKVRIVFRYLSDEEVILIAIDDHDIYR